MATVSRVVSQPQIQINKIGVLTDFSKQSTRALRYAAALAHAYNAGITLAHAYIPPAFAYTAPEVSLTYEAMEDLRERLEKDLVDQTKSAFLHGIRCSTLLSIGGPSDVLEGLHDADIIVVGTKGDSGIEKAALGSTAETIFRSSTVPVLTVGPFCHLTDKSAFSVKTVLYATDFSSGAKIALQYGVSIARKFDADLIMLHVKDDHDVPFSFERAMASQGPLEKLHELAPDSQTTCIVKFGAADAVILEEATNRKADLIVIGARGAGKFASIVSHFGGGTAYEIAANADCPVLTVRNPQERANGS